MLKALSVKAKLDMGLPHLLNSKGDENIKRVYRTVKYILEAFVWWKINKVSPQFNGQKNPNITVIWSTHLYSQIKIELSLKCIHIANFACICLIPCHHMLKLQEVSLVTYQGSMLLWQFGNNNESGDRKGAGEESLYIKRYVVVNNKYM